MKKKVVTILFGLAIFVCACSSSLVILKENKFQQYGITDDDLKKYIYSTNGEVIFYRWADGFDGSRRSASEGVIRKQVKSNQFYKRVALKHNNDGFFSPYGHSYFYSNEKR